VRALSARTRLRLAGVLCLLPLGLAWGPGTGPSDLGARVPARVLLVFAATVLLLTAAQSRTRATVRAVRAAVGAIGVGLVLAIADRAVPAVICLAMAGILVFPVARPRKAGVFVPAPLRR
jgi:hypothetical protein